MTEATDIIFVSLENWDAMWRRNQFVCAELARREPGRKVLFVGPARDVSAAVRRGELSRLRGAATWAVPEHPNITVTRPLKLLPSSVAAGRLVNEAMARAHVRAAARRLGLRSPILWLNPHDAVHMVGRMGEVAVVYDITDDWTRFTQSESLRRRTVRQDAELCRRTDAVIVCSQDLYDSKRKMTGNLHLIPNGVDAGHYRPVLDGEGPRPPETGAWSGPVLGYTGTVHPDRLDVGLVAALAGRFAAGTIALIGPNHLSAADRSCLAAAGNVVMGGPVPYERLPAYMRAFDVCIVPHLVTPFTESLNPIKLWEYLAAGKPIVATPVAGFRDYPEHVRIAPDADAFAVAVREALAEDGRSAGEARRAEASRHSWASRVDEIEAVLASCLDKPVAQTAEAAYG